MAGAGVTDVVVRPIFVDEVGRFNVALREHHWLGHRLTGEVLRYVRDVTFDEDRSQIRTGSSPQIMAAMRNIAISLLRLAGWTNIKQATEKMSRRLDHVLTLLSV